MDQKKLDQQSQHWEASFLNKPEMFGLEPSIAAIKALKSFRELNIKNIVELGAGLGRDTIFFAQNSIYVEALDYSNASIEIIINKSKKLDIADFIKPKVFDVRKNYLLKIIQSKDVFPICFIVWHCRIMNLRI